MAVRALSRLRSAGQVTIALSLLAGGCAGDDRNADSGQTIALTPSTTPTTTTSEPSTTVGSDPFGPVEVAVGEVCVAVTDKVQALVPGATFAPEKGYPISGYSGSWFGDGPLCKWQAASGSLDISFYTEPDPSWMTHASSNGQVNGFLTYDSTQGAVVVVEGIPIVADLSSATISGTRRAALSASDAATLLAALASGIDSRLPAMCADRPRAAGCDDTAT